MYNIFSNESSCVLQTVSDFGEACTEQAIIVGFINNAKGTKELSKKFSGNYKVGSFCFFLEIQCFRFILVL